MTGKICKDVEIDGELAGDLPQALCGTCAGRDGWLGGVLDARRSLSKLGRSFMSKFDNTKAIMHLKDKWGSRPCPMCGKGPWNVQDSTFQLTEYNDGALILGGPVIPVVPVICGNCGYTILVNSILAGVTPVPAPSTEDEKK